jgi:hypothetical protein
LAPDKGLRDLLSAIVRLWVADDAFADETDAVSVSHRGRSSPTLRDLTADEKELKEQIGALERDISNLSSRKSPSVISPSFNVVAEEAKGRRQTR